ncbi:MAG: hypothetical protein J5641_05485 [Bacteroidales bacterium]|nr:hypothetical protein [Bacteroidales bacterium]
MKAQAKTWAGIGIDYNNRKTIVEMKKISLFILSFAVVSTLLFSGCKKDSQVVTLGVRLEPSGADSKLVIDTNYYPRFQAGEMVNVNGENYAISVGNDNTFSVSVEDADAYYSVYPTSILGEGGCTGAPCSIKLPHWQVYEHTNGIQNVQLPVAAKITDGSSVLNFYNLCSLLEVQWTNEDEDHAYKITGIEVTVPGAALYGTGSAQMTGNSSKAVLTDIKKNRVILDIPKDDRETVAANGGVSRKYYVVLPPFEGKKVYVTIRVADPNTEYGQKVLSVKMATSTNVNLPRNYIVPMHIEETPTQEEELSGYFSINPNMKVVFSRGNLQHIGPNSSNPDSDVNSDPETGTWKFADRQYDFFGRNNVTQNSYWLSSTVDLFAWSENESNLYGLYTYDLWLINGQGSGTFVDWATLPIVGTTSSDNWFTMSSSEWYYLFTTRVGGTGDNLRGKARITGVTAHPASDTYGGSHRTTIEGFILLPDDWTPEDVPEGLTFTPNSASDTALHDNTNTYTVAEWARMEAAGAIFLPAAGWGSSYHNRRGERTQGSDIWDTYEDGGYWTCTKKSGSYAESYYVQFEYSTYNWWLKVGSNAYGTAAANAAYDLDWYRMRSVRLVKPAPGYTIGNRQ